MLRVSLVAALAVATVIAAFPSPATAKGPLDPDLAEKVRAYVHDVLGQLNAPGAAVVVVGADGIEFAEGFGTARDDGTPVTPQTPFHVASLSKELTSIAVMQLVEKSELSLDKTVHSYKVAGRSAAAAPARRSRQARWRSRRRVTLGQRHPQLVEAVQATQLPAKRQRRLRRGPCLGEGAERRQSSLAPMTLASSRRPAPSRA